MSIRKCDVQYGIDGENLKDLLLKPPVIEIIRLRHGTEINSNQLTHITIWL